ncbi:MAG: aminotransferase class V-fold PLP-dependent enzyme [Micavibrio aeruginosavorus]|uniref:Aminotransferase class V-fold PLP-dependent enzyme n=1 Tax=Micavibrio aeruginosavorus TaxID=349221 RepID=A0A7T5R0G0_9BACT|nr:MAG: aminotransferase class V-fold PLP-dependent enzyme [Micavibrio aeruginosavorus]
MTSPAKPSEPVCGFDLEHSWTEAWDFSRPLNFNHGSMGFTPRVVLARQEEISRRINAGREEFVREGGFSQLDDARKALAAFVGADENNLVLTANVTESINSVLKSLTFAPGDEVLVTNHIYVNYPALIDECARRQGFQVVKAEIPYRLKAEDDVIAPIMAGVTAATRLAIVDHISSPTAMIFPVARLVKALGEKGVDCFIDGAHAPGQVDIDLEILGAAYYGGNNHKWLCAPLSSGFLYVRPDRQAEIMPAVGSGYATAAHDFITRFSWQGVIDFVPRLMIPDTLRAMHDMHPAGWDGIYRRNHALAAAARRLLCERLGLAAPVPENMIGSMFTLPLGPIQFPPEEMEKSPLHRGYDALVKSHGFGAIFSQFGDDYIVRVTAHLYNKLSDYEALADALAAFIKDHQS